MKTCNDRGSREALATPDHKLTPSPPTHLLMDCLWATLISWSSPTSDDLSTIDMAELGGLWVISCVLVITLCSDRSGGVWIWEVRGVASKVESRLTCYSSVSSCVLSGKPPVNKSHVCERLGILKLRSNFGVMRVCMGKRNLAQSCVLYEVTRQTSQVHVLKLRSWRQHWNYDGLYGEEEFGQKLCLIWSNATTRHNLYSVSLYGEEEFRPKMCLIWSNSQQQDNFGLWKFAWVKRNLTQGSCYQCQQVLTYVRRSQ